MCLEKRDFVVNKQSNFRQQKNRETKHFQTLTHKHALSTHPHANIAFKGWASCESDSHILKKKAQANVVTTSPDILTLPPHLWNTLTLLAGFVDEPEKSAVVNMNHGVNESTLSESINLQDNEIWHHRNVRGMEKKEQDHQTMLCSNKVAFIILSMISQPHKNRCGRF